MFFQHKEFEHFLVHTHNQGMNAKMRLLYSSLGAWISSKTDISCLSYCCTDPTHLVLGYYSHGDSCYSSDCWCRLLLLMSQHLWFIQHLKLPDCLWSAVDPHVRASAKCLDSYVMVDWASRSLTSLVLGAVQVVSIQQEDLKNDAFRDKVLASASFLTRFCIQIKSVRLIYVARRRLGLDWRGHDRGRRETVKKKIARTITLRRRITAV